jgi:cytochrome c oxidase subunit 3
MATTVTGTEHTVTRKTGNSPGGTRRPGGGWPGNGAPFKGGNGGRGDGDAARLADKYRIGMWVALAAIAMMFVALTSAYIVRSVSPEGINDWRPITMPRMLWLSTALILASSITFESARRSLRNGDDGGYSRWLLVTVALGLGFLGSQLLAWRDLVHSGVYLVSNPHSSFFYLLTGAHGVHLLGGILALDYLLLRTWRARGASQALRQKGAALSDAVALYWHFMDGLWLYLFLLLFAWR